MKTTKVTVYTDKGASKFIYSNNEFDIQTGVNNRRAEKAIRKASGFTGRGFTIRGNMVDGQYGRDIGNCTMSVHGSYRIE